MCKEQLLKDLPPREGEKPITGDALPHLQHTQNSPSGIYDDLAKWLFALDYIEERPSGMSVPGARAACIENAYQNVNSELLKPGSREWTHIHPLEIYGGGSQHLSFYRADSDYLIEKGWGEYHPLDAEVYPNKHYGVALLFAPRNSEELEIIKQITLASYSAATNQNFD